MPRMDKVTRNAFLEEPHIGVLASLRRNGHPYTVPVWWLYLEDRFWITGTRNRIWCRQLLKDGRCSLCIEALSPVPGHVGVDGTAMSHLPDDFDIWPISRMLVEKYIGRGDPANSAATDSFFANMRTEPRLLFSLTPEVWRAIDMRVYEGKRSDREFQQQNQANP